MQNIFTLSEDVQVHRPYYYYLQLLGDSISNNVDAANTKIRSTITNLLPHFNSTLNLTQLKSNKKLRRRKFVQTVILIFDVLSSCPCCDQYSVDQFDMLTQIIRIMVLNIYCNYFNNSIRLSQKWNRELIFSNDINSFIAKNYYFHSLYCYNNDILSEKLFTNSG